MRSKKSRILISGAAGFLGSNLAISLVQQGFQVTGIDNFSHGRKENLDPLKGNSGFTLKRGSILNRRLLDAAADGAGTIIHLASLKIPRFSDAVDTLQENALGAMNILRVAAKKGAHIIVASTSDVYGKPLHFPLKEDQDLILGSPFVKRWSYAVTKIYLEHLTLAFAEKYGLPVTVLRFCGAYGPRQALSWWGGPQPVFINAALKRSPLEIHGDGKQTRSFIYVDDLVAGIGRCIGNPRAHGQVFNLGASNEITILDLAKLIWTSINPVPVKLRFVPYKRFGRYEDCRRRIIDISLARRRLGFKPAWSLEDGLRETIAWQKTQKPF
jgi:UDP-glucose 4-epimerase